DARIGFLAHAARYSTAAAEGKLLAPAKTAAEMSRIVFNDYVNITLCVVFIALVLSMLAFGLAAIREALAAKTVTTRETTDEVPELRIARA
ncbi:MAG TPA: carbon starvation protein A, partial [Methylosinus sp.]